MVPADQAGDQNAGVIDDWSCDGGAVFIADLKLEIITSDWIVSP
ncbi:hypothetical protein [Microvirga sp. Mcv34]|nr:hypothetical protein [Microvirga sp. Mcv34]